MRLPGSRGVWGETDKDLIPVAMVHKVSPYADIPSLYDLYVQAASRDSEPERFGMEIFRNGTREMDALPMDLPVGPDYVVGPGDGLAINLWGGVSQRMIRSVDREGRITLPEAGPVLVSGRTLGEVQESVQQGAAHPVPRYLGGRLSGSSAHHSGVYRRRSCHRRGRTTSAHFRRRSTRCLRREA